MKYRGRSRGNKEHGQKKDEVSRKGEGKMLKGIDPSLTASFAAVAADDQRLRELHV